MKKDTAFYDRTLAVTLICFAIAFALILSACSTSCPVSPTAEQPAPVEQPTPQVITVPGPQPTPEIIVAVPQSCIDYMNALVDASQAQTDAFNHPSQDQLNFANEQIDRADSLRAVCVRDGNLTDGNASSTDPES